MTEQEHEIAATVPVASGATGGPRRQSRSLRTALGWLLIAVLVPLGAAGAAFLAAQWKQQREAAVARLLDKARTVQRTVDRELSLDQAVLRTLAESGEIDRRDWRSFHLIAANAAAVRPESWFVLYDRDRQTIVNTRAPFGAGPLPNFGALRSSRPMTEWEGRSIPMAGGTHLEALGTGKPTFSGLIYSPVLNRPAVGTNVPVIREGRAVYGLSLVYSSQFFEKVLQAEAPADLVTALYDQQGRFIARSKESERFVGRQGPPAILRAAASTRDGVGEELGLESVPVVFAYSRSAVNEYLIVAAMRKSAILAPAWRALWLWLGVLLCAGAVGSVLAFRLWRRVGTPLAALARQARSHDERISEVPASGIEEVEALRAALRDRGRAEEALRHAEQQYRTLAENAPEVIARFDRQFRYTYVNEYGAKVHGISARDVIGKTHADLGMAADQVAFWNRHFEEVFAGGVQRTIEFEFDGPTFGKQSFSSLFVPERDDQGEISSILAITRDVTAAKRAEQALRASEERRRQAQEALLATNEQLREADRRKDEFLGMLSHELRNPLAPIRNSAYLLHHARPGSEQARRAQAIIERQTEHLTRLVDDLLDVTRIARGKIELRRSRVDLREVVVRAAEDFRLTMDERGVSFRTVLPDADVWADVDATRITQVVGNLLHNAAKFTRRGDEVVLTLGLEHGETVVAVRDTGAGIAPALLATVFEPFVQGERTLARTEGGLGLGLALVKAITELHGGTVRAESAGKGKGSAFTVRLPLRAALDSLDSTERAARDADRRTGCRRILVVDDNADAAESLADVLRMLGHSVETAHDGPTAITKARARPPHVVLCDIGLPGMSGYEVARALRTAAADGMQLIAVTGYAQPEDVKRATDAGFDAHVAKPCDPEKLERLLG